jgi:hypothetical protein
MFKCGAICTLICRHANIDRSVKVFIKGLHLGLFPSFLVPRPHWKSWQHPCLHFISFWTKDADKHILILEQIIPLLSDDFLFLGVGWDWVHLVRRPLIGLLHQPQMLDECGAIGGMRIGRRNRSTREKSVPVPLCPPQNPHILTLPRTRTAAMGSRLLTAWAGARPLN